MSGTFPPDAALLRLERDWPTLGSYVATAASHAPDAPALVEGTRRITNAGLYSDVRRLVGGLRSIGVTRGDVVTLELPNWWETTVAIHATLRTGAAVNPVVPIYRDREVAFIVGQARPRVLLIPHRFRGFDYVAMCERVLRRDEHAPTVIVVRPEGPLPAGYLSFDELLASGEPDGADHGRVDDIALLLYTSGTTADPKGVLHDHRTLHHENVSIVDLFRLDGESIVFMGSPVTHITGFLYGVLLPPMLGTTAALLDIWDASTARDLIDRERCRFTVGATPFLAGLTSNYESDPGDCPLTAFACGGADVPPDLVRRARDVLDATVVRVYGSSEFPTVSCTGPEGSAELAAETDGPPIGEITCRITDADDGVGELEARGPERFLGYLDASLNADAFTTDGWVRTGDLAAIGPDGAITIHGRKKDIIIRGGENISVREVEEVLLDHPAVKDIAIVAMPDERMGERACAFVVAANDAVPTLPLLVAYLEQRGLARQKFPERVEIVDELPRTASGKVQKFVLRDIAAQTDQTTPRRDR
ncbi:MAG: AMP-binding protein [Ilumatobacteraceae bacterium]|nr:AMP-binding protein [Ilumatobacteraceae bacterium]